jgi:hypothetical protein
MKTAMIFVGIGYAILQTILLLAILAAAARPTPRFEPEIKDSPKRSECEEERELELV